MQNPSDNKKGLFEYNSCMDFNSLLYQRLTNEYIEENVDSLQKQSEYQHRDNSYKQCNYEEDSIPLKMNELNDSGFEYISQCQNVVPQNIIKNSISKEFKCDFEGCEKVYKSKENLKLHINNFHLHVKPYKCKFCMMTFSHRNGIILI